MALTTITTFTDGPDLWEPSLLPGLTDGVLADALGGNDTVSGTNFRDEINGGDGDDSILGNQGDDSLNGGAGNDTIYGGQGNDTITSSAGSDFISANDGNDFITLNSPNNEVYGGKGQDTISINSDGNFVNGNTGLDYIIVNGNDNEVRGGKDSDQIFVESSSNNLIAADNENDTITINDGNNDTVFGGQGDDLIIVNNTSGPVTISGDLGNNRIVLNEGAATADLTLYGGQNPSFATPPEGDSVLEIAGNNDLSSTSLNNISTLEIDSSAAATITASQITSAGITSITGTGGLTVTGTPSEIAGLQGLLTAAIAGGLTVSAQTPPGPPTVTISRTKFGLLSGVTEFFLIDGAQFAPLSVGTPPQAVNTSIKGLAAQFDIIPGTAVTNPLTLDQFEDVVDFGNELNNIQYIPQVTLEQRDELLNSFYDLINLNEFATVNNRFLSVIDTNGTPDSADDLTTLYYSPTGNFLGSSTDNQSIGIYNSGGFTPSNPLPETSFSLEPGQPNSILPSDEFLLV
jgi:hypothetical protein